MKNKVVKNFKAFVENELKAAQISMEYVHRVRGFKMSDEYVRSRRKQYLARICGTVNYLECFCEAVNEEDLEDIDKIYKYFENALDGIIEREWAKEY